MSSSQGELCCVSYTAVQAVEDLRASPRFGHPTNFSVLAGDDEQAKRNYIVGTLLTSILILVTVAVWVVLLIVLPCLGREKTGFLSGARMKAGSKRPQRVRITFLLCAVLVFASTIVLGTKGINGFYNTTNSINNVIMSAQNISQTADESLGEILVSLDKAQNATEAVVGDLSNFCTAIPFLQGATSKVAGAMKPVQQFEGDQISNLQDTAQRVNQKSIEIQNVVVKVDRSIAFQWLFRIPVFIVTIFFIIGIGLAWMRKAPHLWEKIVRYCFVPIFTVLMLFSWIASCTLAVAAIMNADACSGGPSPGNPTSTFETFFESMNGYQPSEPNGKAALVLFNYYFGCGNDFAFSAVVDLLNVLKVAKTELDVFVKALESPLSALCNVGSMTTDAETLLSSITNVVGQLITLVSILSCTSITPLYTQTVNDSLCMSNVTAFAWAFGSLIVIAVCGTTMVMLRSALLQVEEKVENLEESADKPSSIAGKQVHDEKANPQDQTEEASDIGGETMAGVETGESADGSSATMEVVSGKQVDEKQVAAEEGEIE